MSKFTLMNKNKKTFDFEYDDKTHLIVGFDRNYSENEKYAPFGLIKDNLLNENDLYVGEFFLTKPFLEYEVDQINLVKDLSWLDVSKLDGFHLDVRKILETNKLLSIDRIDKIVGQVQLRIQNIIK